MIFIRYYSFNIINVMVEDFNNFLYFELADFI